MTSRVLVVAVVLCAASSAAWAVASLQRTLVVDAVASASHSTGPAPGKIGHVQSVRGTLRDVEGRTIGTFDYSCRVVGTLAHGDVREHCSGNGRTADGKLGFAGRTHAATTWHLFALTSSSPVPATPGRSCAGSADNSVRSARPRPTTPVGATSLTPTTLRWPPDRHRTRLRSPRTHNASLQACNWWTLQLTDRRSPPPRSASSAASTDQGTTRRRRGARRARVEADSDAPGC
jgi:hypothetical protein